MPCVAPTEMRSAQQQRPDDGEKHRDLDSHDPNELGADLLIQDVDPPIHRIDPSSL